MSYKREIFKKIRDSRITNRWNNETDDYPIGTVGGGQRVLETAGYIDKREQLRLLSKSGAALEEYRRSLYPDMEDGKHPVEEEYDPTTRKDYDYFDCHADRVYAIKRLEEQERHFRNSTSRNSLEDDKPKDVTPPPAGETPATGEGA